MFKATTVNFKVWGSGTFLLIALFATSACTETHGQKCGSGIAVPANGQVAAVDYEVDYKSYNSTFLRPEIAKLYGINHAKEVGVVMVSVYQKDSLGVGVEACVSGGARNLLGQIKSLSFDEIREGQSIYHISTFRIASKEHITFEVDVEIAATGKTHALKWERTF